MRYGSELRPMVVDAHVHLFPPEWASGKEALLAKDPYFDLLFSGPRGHMATAEDLVCSMDEAGVDRSVAAGFGWADQGLCREHNDYLLQAVSQYPDRILALATVDPSQPGEAAREAARAVETGLSGVGELMPDGPGYDVAAEVTMAPLMEVAAALAVPVLLHVSEPVGHAYAGKGTVSPAQIVSLAERFPEVTLVCAHWGGGLPFYELMPEVRRSLARVYYDTAAWPLLYQDRAFRAVAEIAPDKILFGTDFPLIGQAEPLRRVARLGLDAQLERAILGGNSLSVYRRRGETC